MPAPSSYTQDPDTAPVGPADFPPPPRRTWGDASAQGVVQAIVRRWWVVALCIAAAVALAVVAGSVRKPTYMARSSVNVGQVDIRVQALSSFVTGASSLAASYSRIATSERIVDEVAEDLGTTPADVRSRLQATAVPSSPIFDVIGSGETPDDATRLANATVKRMRAYVAERSGDDAGAARLLKAFSAQSRETAELQRRYERLKARRSDALSLTAATPATDVPSAADVTSAQVEYETAQLKAQSLSSQYQARIADTSASAGVELLNRATAADSDKRKRLQQFVAGAIVAGAAIGAGLALLLDRRRPRRRRRPVHAG